MQPTEPPSPATGRPNLLAATRCSSDVQQQILARLEIKAAEKARMMRVARQSLRVAFFTTAGIGVVVAMLVVARHRNMPPPAVIPAVVAQEPAAPLPPMPVIKVDDERDRLGAGALAALLDAGAEPEAASTAEPAPQSAVVRIVGARSGAIGNTPPRAATRPLPRALPRARQMQAVPVKGASHRNKLQPPRHVVLALKTATAPARTTASRAPVDTDVNLITAILLHASRPAVVPPAIPRPPCAARNGHLPGPACGEPVPDP